MTIARIAFWVGLYLLFLGVLDIDVRHADGLHIQIVGWPTAIKKRRKRHG